MLADLLMAEGSMSQEPSIGLGGLNVERGAEARPGVAASASAKGMPVLPATDEAAAC